MSIPLKKFNAGSIQVAVWENESKEGNRFNTVSIQRNYKDKNDEWKSSSTLKVNDLPKAMVALQRAYEYLVLKENSRGEQEKETANAIA
jgi:hypothetical protein